MQAEQSPDADASSPFDPYIAQAIGAIAIAGDVSSTGLSQLFVSRLGWLPGFAEVMLSILRTNGLIVVNEWEPGKVNITHRGRRWMDSSLVSR